MALIANPIPVFVKKSVVAARVNRTTMIMNKSKLVKGAVFPNALTATSLTGDGNPRSSAAQRIPARDCKIPKIPSEAITGTVARMDSLAKIPE
ncbi:unannotated protein [freshwater metagenome]|uniref:Unannotated protein n=1 Tax=freshwater metagenome TaxID=449393 RepID=A0A6J6PBU9_9ZZZZ